jgi:phosphoribosylanthranilate isomerase
MGVEPGRSGAAVAVKICGLTRAADAAAAVRLGAAYLGVVFAVGPRQVTAAAARQVAAEAGGRPVFGVFDVQSVGEILRARDAAALTGAQLHGAYDAAAAALLRAEGLLVWRVAHLAGAADLDRLAGITAEADAVLVEPRVPHAMGGTGVALGSELAVEARRRLAGIPMVLAGGLRPDTVAAAAALVRPEVADVSSGIERSPGEKDPVLLARFLEAVLDHHARP